MTIQVTGKNLDVGEALRGYVLERVEQTVEKFIGRETTGHVRIEKEHGEFRTDCTIHLWQGMSLEAHAVAPDAYRSADRACERLEKRVRRHKRRLKRRSGGDTPRKHTAATDYVIQAAQDGHEEQDDANPVIIAESEMSVHEMAVSDAVMRMDLSDRSFVVFRNGSHGEINVVYRRDDGNIGWIDPVAPLRSSSEAVAQNKGRSSSEAVAQNKGRSSSETVAQNKRRSSSEAIAQTKSRSSREAHPKAKQARKRH
jgi:ribosomal subunit interface protein